MNDSLLIDASPPATSAGAPMETSHKRADRDALVSLIRAHTGIRSDTVRAVYLAQLSTNSGLPPKGHFPAAQKTGNASAILQLRRLTGLTWSQLARLFGTSRRSLHFWASGRKMSAGNEERLQRILAVLKKTDRGSASKNRVLLMQEVNGVIPLDLLTVGDYEAFFNLVGKGPVRTHPEPSALSPAAAKSRLPLPPENLVDAHQDRVHKSEEVGRAARTPRRRSGG